MNIRVFGVPATECMSAQTRPWYVLSYEREFFCLFVVVVVVVVFVFFFGGGSKPCQLQGKNPLYQNKNSPQRRVEPTTLSQTGQRAQHTTNELFRPHRRSNCILPPSFGLSSMGRPTRSLHCSQQKSQIH